MNESRDRALARLEVIRARAQQDPGALKDLERFVKWANRTFGSDSPVTLESEFVLLANMVSSEPHGVITVRLKRLQDRCEILDRDHPILPRLRMLLAQAARRSGSDDALDQYRAELAKRELEYGEEAQATGRARLNLVVALRESGIPGHVTEARQLVDRELAWRVPTYGQDDPFTLTAFIAKANLLLDEAERWGAGPQAQDALDISSKVAALREDHFGPGHPHTVKARQTVGRALIVLDRLDEAIWWLFNLHADAAATHEPGRTAELLATALARTNDDADHKQALLLAREARHHYQRTYGLDGTPTRRVLRLLATLQG